MENWEHQAQYRCHFSEVSKEITAQSPTGFKLGTLYTKTSDAKPLKRRSYATFASNSKHFRYLQVSSHPGGTLARRSSVFSPV
jgi:hypothetical protein